MQECNLPRNNWLQTHQDDGLRGEAGKGLASVYETKTAHRIDRFAHALKNSNGAAPGSTARGASARFFLPRFG